MSKQKKKDGRKKFTFKVTYFTGNFGYFLLSTTFERSVREDGAGGPVMSDVVAHLRGSRDTGSALPGLTDFDRFTLTLVEHVGSTPHLITVSKY